MYIHRQILFFILVYSLSLGQAPLWVRFISDGEGNFFEAKRDFENYRKTHKKQRGDGQNPFMRYAYFLEERVDKKGHYDRFATWKAWKQLQSAKIQNSGNWTPLGPSYWTNPTGWNPGVGRVNDVTKPSANSSRIYVASPSGGVWYSSNDGNSWSPMTDTFPTIGASSIVVDYTDSNIVYILTGDGDGGDTYSLGVFKSTDGGNTWQTTGLSFSPGQYKRFYKLIMHPSNPNILFAVGRPGIYKTTDGGNTWTQVSSQRAYDIEFHPTNHDTIYACKSSFFRSTDGGNTWQAITTGLPPSSDVIRMAIAVTPAAPDVVYLLAGATGSYLEGFYKSNDAGSSFVKKIGDLSVDPNLLGYAYDGSDSSGQAWYDLAIAADPNDPNLVYTGGINVWKTTDGGSTWSIVAHWYAYGGPGTDPYVHADIHQLKFIGNTLYAGTDGGVFRSSDGGNTWQDLSNGLYITQFYRFSNVGNKILAGAQDNGTNLYTGLSSVWAHVRGADGMEAIIDPSNTNIMYASSQYGNLKKTIDNGSSWQGIGYDIDENGPWVTPYVIHPTNSNILLAGYKSLWKTTDGGSTWTKVLPRTAAGSFKSIAFAPSNPSIVFASTADELYKSTDGGDTWQDISSQINLGPIAINLKYIRVAPWDPNLIFIANAEKVIYSSDGGNTWTIFSAGLPYIPMNCIEFDPLTQGVYVGTDIGIYYSDATFSSWQPFFNGLPNVMVYELEVSGNKLRAATYGRGVWESDLYGIVTGLTPPEKFLVSVYPNPTFSDFKVEVGGVTGKKVFILYSVQGQEILRREFSGDYLIVPHEALNGRSGLFLYRLQTEKGIRSGKISIY